METSSQQTETSNVSGNRNIWKKCWASVIPLAVGIFFVIIALVFAIIFTGLGLHRHSNHSSTNCTNYDYQAGKVYESSLSTANICEYSFVAALISNRPRLYLCTSVILTNRYLMTGASCFTTKFKDLCINVGTDYWEGLEGTLYGIQSIVINERFDGVTQENNIALIKVNRTIIMEEKVQAAKFVSNYISPAKGVVVGWSGWAITERNHTRLVKQELAIWKLEECRKYLGARTTPKFVCASLTKSHCNLEVTGPLIVEGKLLGIWSWGLSCPQTPSIFADVRRFRRWIKRYVYQH